MTLRHSMDGVAFGRMIVSASAAIELKKQKINELNVFLNTLGLGVKSITGAKPALLQKILLTLLEIQFL